MPMLKIGDLDMYYEIHGEENEIDLVLIQGLGLDILSWYYQIPEFSKKYRVIAFDNRDVGRTTKVDISYTMDTFAEDTYQLLKKLGVEKAHILGFSMGGMIAQTFALKYPEMVRSLCLCATIPVGPGSGINVVTVWKDLYRTLPRESYLKQVFPWIWTSVLQNDELCSSILDQWVNAPYIQPAEAFARQCETIEKFNLVEQIPKISASTLVLVGGWDVLTPVWLSEWIDHLIPNTELKVIPETGHLYIMEKPEDFNKGVLEFLEKH